MDYRQIQKARAIAPTLSKTDIAAAVSATGKKIPKQKEKEFRDSVNVILLNFLMDRWCRLAVKRPAAKTVKRLEQVTSASERLLKAIGPDERPNEIHRSLANAAAFGDRDKLRLADLAAFRGDEEVSQLIASIAWLGEVAAIAAKNASRGKKTSKARHEGEPEKHTLFGNINGLWLDFFNEVPGTSIPASGGDPCGPYIRFVSSILDTLTSKAPPTLLAIDPKLTSDLAMTPQAIRGYFMKTGRTKIKRMS